MLINIVIKNAFGIYGSVALPLNVHAIDSLPEEIRGCLSKPKNTHKEHYRINDTTHGIDANAYTDSLFRAICFIKEQFYDGLDVVGTGDYLKTDSHFTRNYSQKQYCLERYLGKHIKTCNKLSIDEQYLISHVSYDFYFNNTLYTYTIKYDIEKGILLLEKLISIKYSEDNVKQISTLFSVKRDYENCPIIVICDDNNKNNKYFNKVSHEFSVHAQYDKSAPLINSLLQIIEDVANDTKNNTLEQFKTTLEYIKHTVFQTIVFTGSMLNHDNIEINLRYLDDGYSKGNRIMLKNDFKTIKNHLGIFVNNNFINSKVVKNTLTIKGTVTTKDTGKIISDPRVINIIGIIRILIVLVEKYEKNNIKSFIYNLSDDNRLKENFEKVINVILDLKRFGKIELDIGSICYTNMFPNDLLVTTKEITFLLPCTKEMRNLLHTHSHIFPFYHNVGGEYNDFYEVSTNLVITSYRQSFNYSSSVYTSMFHYILGDVFDTPNDLLNDGVINNTVLKRIALANKNVLKEYLDGNANYPIKNLIRAIAINTLETIAKNSNVSCQKFDICRETINRIGIWKYISVSVFM